MCINMKFVATVTEQMSFLAVNIPRLYNTAAGSVREAMFKTMEDQQLELVLCFRVLEQHFKGVFHTDGSVDRDALVHSTD